MATRPRILRRCRDAPESTRGAQRELAQRHARAAHLGRPAERKRRARLAAGRGEIRHEDPVPEARLARDARRSHPRRGARRLFPLRALSGRSEESALSQPGISRALDFHEPCVVARRELEYLAVGGGRVGHGRVRQQYHWEDHCSRYVCGGESRQTLYAFRCQEGRCHGALWKEWHRGCGAIDRGEWKHSIQRSAKRFLQPSSKWRWRARPVPTISPLLRRAIRHRKKRWRWCQHAQHEVVGHGRACIPSTPRALLCLGTPAAGDMAKERRWPALASSGDIVFTRAGFRAAESNGVPREPKNLPDPRHIRRFRGSVICGRGSRGQNHGVSSAGCVGGLELRFG